MPEILLDLFARAGLDPYLAGLFADTGGLVILALLAWLLHMLARSTADRTIRRVVARSSTDFDDTLVEAGVFRRLAHLVPALLVTFGGPAVFVLDPDLQKALQIFVNVYLVIIILLVVNAVLNAAVMLYERKSTTRQVPLKGFIQAIKLVASLFCIVLVLSILLGRSPIYFLSGLGALTAVLLLIFRDAILGFVAGIQISVNEMVRIGDWIEMPKYGADGDVVDVTLTTVKVQNWDKTITTVPTYALISEPVKNWRGMFQTGGRRIKRSLFLDLTSVRFLDDDLLKKMMTFRRLRPHLEQRLPEITAWNEQQGEDLTVPVNGRRLTNVGCFRAYCVAYLKTHAHIHQSLTQLVRQLQPTDRGLPLEIYCFTANTAWAHYESVQADIFDHLYAVIPEFGLRAFQSPSGHDLGQLAGLVKASPAAAVPPAPAE